ncbi:MAG: M1 family metallopeptidase [Fidelibacterota bacterium]
MYKKLFAVLSLFSFLFAGQDYFQQYVAYEIRVTLNDSAHTLSTQEKILYVNNSPDTLNFIWFHLWPNAYKNDSTAFAKQKIRNRSTRFHYSKAKDRGYIDSLNFSVNGKTVNWEYHPENIDIAKVFLPESLAPGDSITIETPFFVKLPKVFSRLGHTGKHYEITQWYPKPAVYDRDGWHPMPYLDQGEFYSEFGQFDVYITLPRDYRIMATGDLVDGNAEYAWLDSLVQAGDSLHALPEKEFKARIKELRKQDKKSRKGKKRKKSESELSAPLVLKTLHFHQENVHDFAWFADRRWIVRKGTLFLADSTREITCWSFYLPKNAKLWENSIEYIHDAGYWYSRFYGDYPYNHITAVDGDLSAGGGMEYPNITVISSGGSKDLLEMVIMHEVGHNWFYGILGSNERDHTWMDEGLNEYTNIRYWEKKYASRDGQFIIQDFIQNKLGIGKTATFDWLIYIQYLPSARSLDSQPLNLTANDYERMNYGQHYSKTAVFSRFVQHYLGDEKLNEIMQDYYETWKFKHPQPEDFQASFKKYVDEDLSWYLNDVFNKTNYIDYGIKTNGNQFTVTNYGTMNTPVEIAFYDRQDAEIGRSWVKGFTGSTDVSGPQGVVKAVIDPDGFMPDADRTNHTTKRKTNVNFVWDEPNYFDRDFNLLPWLFSYNVYNGFTPGLMLYSGFTPGFFGNGLSLKPMWDFNNKRLVGSLLVRKGLVPNALLNSGIVSFSAGDYSGRSGAAFAFEGTIKKPIVSYPQNRIAAQLQYHDIDTSAVDPMLYDGGQFTVGNLSFKRLWSPNPFYQFNASGQLRGNTNFLRASFTATANYEYSKAGKIDFRLWTGAFLNDQKVPRQYRTYYSGGVDPDFESYILDRTSGQSAVNIYTNQYIQDGPGLRGVALDSSDTPLATSGFAWGVNLTHKSGKLTAVFLDAAGGDGLNDTYVDAGLQIGVFIIPLYQSWEPENKYPDSKQWILDRLRFQLDFSDLIRIGF